MEINIPLQRIRAKWKGGLINEGGIISSEYGIYIYMYICIYVCIFIYVSGRVETRGLVEADVKSAMYTWR